MKLYLIRHGQTDWNTLGKIQGSTDIPLNKAGIWQAECLACGMETRPVVRIYASPLERAAETARAIGAKQGVGVQVLNDLKEMGFGYWEGMTWEEIGEKYPEEFKLWCGSPVEAGLPGGEPQSEIIDRCKRVIREMTAQADGDIAVVSHGGTLAYLINYLLRNNPSRETLIVSNASITTVHYNPLTQDFTILEMNDVSHLT